MKVYHYLEPTGISRTIETERLPYNFWMQYIHQELERLREKHSDKKAREIVLKNLSKINK